MATLKAGERWRNDENGWQNDTKQMAKHGKLVAKVWQY
jgi:hypothetical protein